MSTLEDALRKVPPQSLEAEESVLGGILLDSHALDRVIEVMGPDDFYRETNRKIFLAMLALTERGEPIDYAHRHPQSARRIAGDRWSHLSGRVER